MGRERGGNGAIDWQLWKTHDTDQQRSGEEHAIEESAVEWSHRMAMDVREETQCMRDANDDETSHQQQHSGVCGDVCPAARACWLACVCVCIQPVSYTHLRAH